MNVISTHAFEGFPHFEDSPQNDVISSDAAMLDAAAECIQQLFRFLFYTFIFSKWKWLFCILLRDFINTKGNRKSQPGWNVV